MTVVQEIFAELGLKLDGNSFGSADKALGGIKDKAVELAKFVAAAFAVDAIVGFVHETIQAVPAIGDVADQAGITAESLQRMRFAFSQSGADAQDFDKAIKKLSSSIGKAATGNEAIQKSFADIGVKVKDSSGKVKKADVVFLEIADKLSTMDDASKKAALTAGLLGDEVGQKLIAGMSQGSKGLQELGQKAEDLGIILGTDTIQRFGAVDDRINALIAQFDALKRAAVVPLLEVLEVMLDFIESKLIPVLKAIPKFLKDNERVFKALALIIGTVLVGALAKYIFTLGAALVAQAVVAAEASFLAGGFGVLVVAIDAVVASMTALIGRFIAFAAPIAAVIAVIGLLVVLIEDLWAGFEGGTSLIMKLSGHWGEFADTLWKDIQKSESFLDSFLLSLLLVISKVAQGIEFVINTLILGPIEKAMDIIDTITQFFDADSNGKQIMIRDGAKSVFGANVDAAAGIAKFAGAENVASGLQNFKESGSSIIGKALTPSKSVNLNAGGTTINVEIGSSNINGQDLAKDIASFANDGQSRIIQQAAQDIIAAP